jgi:ankyrin repeat protein
VLLHVGADVDAINLDKETPLSLLISREDNVEILRVLLEGGADYMHFTPSGTPLQTGPTSC